MANINKSYSLNWQGNADDLCSTFDYPSADGKIIRSYSPFQNGLRWTQGSPTGSFDEIRELKCGNSYYINMVVGQSVFIEGVVSGTTGSNAGNITTLYPMSFVFDPESDNETFNIINEFYNNKPVYKASSSDDFIWYNNAEYVKTVSIGNGVTSNTYKNGACIPNATFTRGIKSKPTNSHFVEVSGFTGAKANLNGNYYHVGYYNGEKTYRDSMCVDHFYYYDGGRWILTDTAFNGQGCYIIGTSDKFGCVDASLGNNCFDGQRACVFDGNVDPRSLMTEDALKSLATEDSLKVLITEAEL